VTCVAAGFNSTLREGNVTHHEYMQVGKGRDVGLNQIALFEAKIANGNGEQTLSRDIYRLGHRFDFFRMLSCYYTTIGFYFSTMVWHINSTSLCLICWSNLNPGFSVWCYRLQYGLYMFSSMGAYILSSVDWTKH
jgi:hypothetical protein